MEKIRGLVLGPEKSGKSYLCNCFVKSNSSKSMCYNPTIGIEFYSKYFKNSNKKVHLYEISDQHINIRNTYINETTYDFVIIVCESINYIRNLSRIISDKSLIFFVSNDYKYHCTDPVLDKYIYNFSDDVINQILYDYYKIDNFTKNKCVIM